MRRIVMTLKRLAILSLGVVLAFVAALLLPIRGLNPTSLSLVDFSVWLVFVCFGTVGLIALVCLVLTVLSKGRL